MTYRITIVLAALVYILMAEPGPKLPALFLGAVALSILLLLAPTKKKRNNP